MRASATYPEDLVRDSARLALARGALASLAAAWRVMMPAAADVVAALRHAGTTLAETPAALARAVAVLDDIAPRSPTPELATRVATTRLLVTAVAQAPAWPPRRG